MATLEIEIPDDLMEKLSPVKDQIPDLLRRSLNPLALPAQVYRHVLDFLISQPTNEQVMAFRPTDEMVIRLRDLVNREQAGTITPEEQQELAEYERIEHLVVMFKSDVHQKVE